MWGQYRTKSFKRFVSLGNCAWQDYDLGSGCGSVGRAVASNTRGPRFESSYWQTFILDICLFSEKCIEKTKIKKKMPRMAHLLSHASKPD